MKRATFLFLLALTAPAAQAETIWVGNVFVTAASSACGTSAAPGDFARIIYRPASTALGNGADSYLAYITQRGGVSMLVPGNTFRAGVNYSAEDIGSYITFHSGSGGITAWKLVPATLIGTTKHATVTTTLANFFNISGCTVSLNADLELAQ